MALNLTGDILVGEGKNILQNLVNSLFYGSIMPYLPYQCHG